MISPNKILNHWNISGDVQDISDKGYSGSLIYKVTTQDKQFILKGYPEYISIGILNKTHEILNLINSKGLKVVPKVISTVNGETVVVEDSKQWDLVEFLKGEHLTLDANSSQLESIAINISKLHKYSEDIQINENVRLGNPTKPQKIQEDFAWWDNISTQTKEKLINANLFSTFQEFIELSKLNFEKHLKNFEWDKAFQELPKNIIHRDLTKRNLLFDGDEVSGLIDFESLKYGIRLDDIARVIIEFTDASEEKVNEFIGIYSSIGEMPELEFKSLFTWIILLNCGVTMWALKHYTELHILNHKEHSSILNRVQKAIKVYKKLEFQNK